jgi:hypothetical protein
VLLHPEQLAPRLGPAAAPPESAKLPLAARYAPAARLRAAAQSARQLRPVWARRSALPERHSAPECSAASPETEMESAALRRAGLAMPKVVVLRLRAASPETEWESAALRRAGSAVPKVVVLRPLAAQPEFAALLQAGWAMPVAIA